MSLKASHHPFMKWKFKGSLLVLFRENLLCSQVKRWTCLDYYVLPYSRFVTSEDWPLLQASACVISLIFSLTLWDSSTRAEDVLASSFPLFKIYQLSTMKTIIASHTRTSQGNPRRLGPCFRLLESTTSSTAQLPAPGLAGKTPLWQSEALWVESGTHLVRESLSLPLVPKSEKGLWVSVGESHPLRFLCVAGTWQLAATHTILEEVMSLLVYRSKKRNNKNWF